MLKGGQVTTWCRQSRNRLHQVVIDVQVLSAKVDDFVVLLSCASFYLPL